MWPILGENLVLLWAFEQFNFNDALLHDIDWIWPFRVYFSHYNTRPN
jgi:hypothetical protein